MNNEEGDNILIEFYNFDIEEDDFDFFLTELFITLSMLLGGEDEEDFEDDEIFKKDNNIIIKYKKLDKNVDFCSICQLNENQVGVQLSCNHIFHKECIIEWGKYKQCCPECRKKIKVKL